MNKRKLKIFLFLQILIIFPAIFLINFRQLHNWPKFNISNEINLPIDILNSGWVNTTVISDDNTGWNNWTSYKPSITIDKNGVIHVVWEDDTDGEWGTDKEIMYVNYSNGIWSNATAISDIYGWNNGDSYEAEIATDKYGNIHVVWHDDTSGEWGTDTEIMYVNYTNGNWSNATAISDIYGWNDAPSLDPAIAIDNNMIHVVWWDMTNGEWGTDWEIMYANYTGIWSNATVISDDGSGWNNDSSIMPDIAIGNDGIIHVVWEDETNGTWGTDVEIMYTNYTNGNWSSVRVISDDITGWNDYWSRDSSIAIDDNGTIYVVWEDATWGEWGTDYEIMLVNYTNGIWANATIISDIYGWNDGLSWYPKIVIDSNGNIHIVWEDDTVGEWGGGMFDSEIMYINYTHSGWSNATVISDDINKWNNGDSKYPDIAIDKNGNIHVVWHDNTNGAWGTDSEIMYVNNSPSKNELIPIPFTTILDGGFIPIFPIILILGVIALLSIAIRAVVVQRRTPLVILEEKNEPKYEKEVRLSDQEIRDELRELEQKRRPKTISLEDLEKIITKPLTPIPRDIHSKVMKLKNLNEKQKELLLRDLASLDEKQREEWLKEVEDLD